MKLSVVTLRISGVLALVFSIIGAPAFASSVTIGFQDASGPAGSSAVVPLMVKSAAGLGALQMSVGYDPDVLEPTEVEPGALLSGLVDFNIVSPGVLSIAMATSQAVNGDGELMLLSFNVLGGSESLLELSEVRAWEQATSFEMMVTAESGRFTVGGGLPFWGIGSGVLVLLAVAVVLVFWRRSRSRASARPGVKPPPVAVRPSAMPRADGPITSNPDGIPLPVTPVPAANPAPSVEPTAHCNTCGTSLSPGSSFCSECGSPVEDICQCPQCGHKRSKRAKFCTNCGATV